MRAASRWITLLLLVACGWPRSGSAQDFMLQGWYWDYPKTANGYLWADTLRLRAQQLHESGFTYVWLPPLSRAASGANSNGYDPKDLFDLGEYGLGATGFGSRADYDALIAEFNSVGLKAVADVVYNHRDGGLPENNPSVAGWIRNMSYAKIAAGDQPYPSDRFRLILPIGGSTGRGAGTYYFKFGSKSQHPNFFNKPYKVYMETRKVGYQGQPNQFEFEPNGGGGCGEPNNAISLGVDLFANVDGLGCKIDEFALTLSSNDFNAAGDTVFIYLNNRNVGGLGDYSDHTVLELYYSGGGGNIEGALAYQTWTDFRSLASGRGDMNHPNFKPNGNPTQLAGDYDAMFFFYDYDQKNVASTIDTLQAWTRWLWHGAGIRGYRLDAVKHFEPKFTGDLLDNLHDYGIDPGMVVGEFFDGNSLVLKQWIDNVLANMDGDTKSAIAPRVFDFSLRYALEAASDQFGYDARNVFNASIVDAQSASGFNVVTFTDNHDFRGSGQPIDNDPLLAYAYILTNNQVGLPSVYYYDYYNRGLRTEIDKLIRIHQDHISGASQRDYLSRLSTPYPQSFTSGLASTTLFFQLSGTPAGRDVLVAINYAGLTLNVTHGVNTSTMNLASGDTLTDMLGKSTAPYMVVDNSGSVQFQIPPRSYAVWVQGAPREFLSANAGSSPTICAGDTVPIGGNPTAAGGVFGGPYVITWAPNDGSLSDIHAANPQAWPATTTTYTVTVTESSSGLTVTDDVTVTVNPLPAVTFDAVGSLCLNDPPVDLSALVSPGGGTFSGPGISGSTFDPAAAGEGTHSLTYAFTDGNGCSNSASQSVTVKPVPTAEVSGDDAVCTGTTHNYTATTNAASPSYSWSITGGTINGSATNNPVSVTAGSAGTMILQVTVTDGTTSCSNSATQNVQVDANTVTVAAGENAAACLGVAALLNGTAAGGSGTYTFAWTVESGPDLSPAQFNDPAAEDPQFTPAAVGDYVLRFTVEDGVCLPVFGEVALEVNAPPAVSINGADPVNTGTTHTYSADTDAANPNYLWSVTGGTINGSNTSSAVSVTAGTIGDMIVRVRVTDGNTTCSDSAGKHVTVTASNLTAYAGENQAICADSSLTLNGEAAGGDGTYTLAWSVESGPNTSNAQFSDPALEDPVFTPTTAGEYVLRFTVDDGVNAPVSDEVTITVHALPLVEAGSDRELIYGLTTTLGGSPTASGNGPFTYLWSPAIGLLDPPEAANPQAKPLTTTTYTVTVTDANGCSSSDQVTVTVAAYVFLSNDYVKINKNKQSDGNIHSNARIEFGRGAPGTHTGNLTALDDITIREKNTIIGDVTAGDELYLLKTAIVTGAKNAHATVAAVTLPTFTFSAGGPSLTVKPGTSRTLSPGSYGTILVDDKATLSLSTGDYFIDLLNTDPSAVLSLNVANGPINIYVVTDLDFDTKVQVLIVGGTTEQVTFVTLQDPKIDIGKKALIRGTLVAQHAEVHFSSEARFKGAVIADGITLDANVKFQFHTSTAVFPKEPGEDEEEEESQEQLSVAGYELAQNYPNPFNPATLISFALPQAGAVTLQVYSETGQQVRTLLDGEMAAGQHEVSWNGRNESDQVVAAGLYFYRIIVQGNSGETVFTETRRMTLLK